MNCWPELVTVWAVVKAVFLQYTGLAAPDEIRANGARRASGAHSAAKHRFAGLYPSELMARVLRGRLRWFWCKARRAANERAERSLCTSRLVFLTAGAGGDRATGLCARSSGVLHVRPIRSSC
jgi:hypothetical protein